MQLHTISDDTCALDKYLVAREAGCMEAIVLLAALLMLDVLAAKFGYDSRIIELRNPRGWWR
jgi:hypothetical protein